MVEFPDRLTDEHENLLSEIMAAHGYRELRPTQRQAFESGILDGGNHLLVAKTGNGKTFCAETVTKQALDAGGRVGYLVPSHNLVNDKTDELNEWAEGDYSVVQGSYGRGDIVVATFDSFFSAMIRGSGNVTSLDRVILDDFHILYDRYRGPSLEKAIAATTENNIPIFAMSATVGNPVELAEWLNANLVVSDEDRGIEIAEHPQEVDQSQDLKNQIADLVAEHTDKAPFLVFNSSRRKCEARAEVIAEREVFGDSTNRNFRSELRSQVDTAVTRKLNDLARMMENGVAFHHAGLPRSILTWIEECFRDGDIQAICCTPTLAFGFDSPVQSVVVSELKRYDAEAGYQTYIGTWEYVQWIGRAARPGMGYDEGHAYVLFSDFDEASERYFGERELERVTTHMKSQGELQWLLLELIEMGWKTKNSLEEFMQETLLWHQLSSSSSWPGQFGESPDRGDFTTEEMDRIGSRSQTATGPPQRLKQLRSLLSEQANWLLDYGFIQENPIADEFEATELGSASVEFNFSTWSSYRLRSVYNLCRRLESYDSFVAIDLLREMAELEDPYVPSQGLEDSFTQKLTSAGLDSETDVDLIAGVLGWYWCQNLPLDEIEERTGVEGTTIGIQARNLSRTIDAASALFEALNVDDPSWYRALVGLVEHGVPRGQLPIAEEVSGIGRAKIRNIREYLSQASSSGDMAMDFSATTVTGGLAEAYLTLEVSESQFKDILRTPTGIGNTLSERLFSFIETFVDEQGYVEDAEYSTESFNGVPDDGWYNPDPLFGKYAVESDAGTAPSVVSRPTSLNEW